MKYLTKILMFSLLVFVFACDKEEDDDNGGTGGGNDPMMMMTAEEVVKENLSIDAGWTITAIETNLEVLGDEVTASNIEMAATRGVFFGILDSRLTDVIECEMDDVIKFSDNLNIAYDEGLDVCTADGTTQLELLFENSTWNLKDVNTITIVNSYGGENKAVDYNIDTLTDSEFVLSSSRDGNNLTVGYDFQFTNTADIKITMTKAN